MNIFVFLTFFSLCNICIETKNANCKNPNYIPQQLFKMKLNNKREENENQFLFFNNILPDALKLEVKSEPLPEYNDANVKTGVGKNFYDLVINNNKDTMVTLYAPWCPHCQSFLPSFEELGEQLRDENVSLVKMDATKNDPPGNYDAPSYPTIYWATKDAKAFPHKYQGGRDVNEMLKFIAAHATTELKHYDRNGKLKN